MYNRDIRHGDPCEYGEYVRRACATTHVDIFLRNRHVCFVFISYFLGKEKNTISCELECSTSHFESANVAAWY